MWQSIYDSWRSRGKQSLQEISLLLKVTLASKKTSMCQVICDRLIYGRKPPWQASSRDRKHGRNLRWPLKGMLMPPRVVENWPCSATILAVSCKGTRDGMPVHETRYYVTSLKTTAKVLLQHVRDLWSIENS